MSVESTSRSEPARAADLQELAFMQWLVEQGYVAPKPLADGKRYATLNRLMYHWSLVIGTIGNRFGYDDRYCYTDDFAQALTALVEFDGTTEPKGWERHPATGRRRWGGDEGKEYLAP